MKLFLFLILLSPQVFANGFVGNPGLGIEVDGKLYLQDLFSIGVHKNPYIGSAVNPKFANPHQFNFEYPADLLAKKLTDIEEASPGLGNYLQMTIRQYDWILITEELKLIPDDSDPVQIPVGAKSVQIANRLRSLIRIHRDSWNRLDEANKVALIIHEAVYSFVKAERRGVFFYQSAQTARDLTAQFFLVSFKGSILAKTILTSPKSYGLNLLATDDSLRLGTIFLTAIIGYQGFGTDMYQVALQRFEFAENNFKPYRKFVAEGCSLAGKEAQIRGQFITVYISSFYDELVARQVPYKASETENQVAIQFMLARRYVNNDVDQKVKTSQECIWLAQDRLEDIQYR